jgi:hypothetical protein
MTQLIEFPLETGESIMFEAHIISQSSEENLSSQTSNIIKTEQKMASVLSAVGPAAATLVNNLKNSIGPDEIALEFGLGFTFGADGHLKMLIDAGTNLSFKVNIIWKKPQI